MRARGSTGRRRVAIAWLVLMTAAAVLPGVTAAAASVAVIVRGDRAADAITGAGGRVTMALPIVDGYAAEVPADAIDRLRASDGVWDVSPDATVRVQDDATAGQTPPAPDSAYDAAVRADALRAATGADGSGVTVALVDTGVATVPGLAGRIVPVNNGMCLNLSGEPDCGDSYGHGTFLAGLIAGTGDRPGVAPGARVLSVKIAGRDGSADVSTVVAAIQWVVTMRNAFGIRVLNLSLGTDSTQSWTTDPLNYAVERAWRSGLTVVVAASNRGPAAGTVSKPGDDPWVLTVGATDDHGTAAVDDDTVTEFSGRGPTAAGVAKPDVLAPGAHLVSLRAPGSAIDQLFPSGVDSSSRRGSGTSMATAVTSGVVALLLSANPTMTPDRIKYALVQTARPVVGGVTIDAAAALDAPAGLANQGLATSDGRGSVQASRGSMRVADHDGNVVSSEVTSQRRGWDRDGFTGTWDGNSWNRLWGSSWYGSSWYGSSWYQVAGSSWYGSSWYGSSWYGSSWYGSSWYGVWE